MPGKQCSERVWARSANAVECTGDVAAPQGAIRTESFPIAKLNRSREKPDRASESHCFAIIGDSSKRKRSEDKTSDLLFQMVGREGVEPSTLGLRVPCSTN